MTKENLMTRIIQCRRPYWLVYILKDYETACDVPVTNVTFFTYCTCATVWLLCTVNSTYVAVPVEFPREDRRYLYLF